MHKALLGKPAIYELHLISRVESVKGSIDYHAEYPYLFHGLGKMKGPYKSALMDDAYRRPKTGSFVTDGRNKERAEKDGK